ncbi:MAG TPA: DUF5666 domain-containing protein [Candidatus Limnocylindrales bacterium]|nr:DUF5666 domain-containing protein [Candidatus Limnocylindrales bacterium]
MQRFPLIAALLIVLSTGALRAQQPPGSATANPSRATHPGSSVNPGMAAGKTATSAEPAPAPPPMQPRTEILDSSATSGALATDGHDPILDPPPFPSGTTTLVGGVIRDVDRIRNRMTIKVFGGSRWTINFDERTHIFHNGAETTQLALKKGERVYVDTMLDDRNHNIFARNIRVGVATPPADADGQVMEVDTHHGEVTLRDNINSVPVHFGVDKDTRISNGNTPMQLAQVKPGTLVHVAFSPESGNRGMAREIQIIAAPGAAFTFAGKITHLDLRRGLLAVENSTDRKIYDIHFSPRATPDLGRLMVGVPVKIVAIFEGYRYTAQTIDVTADAASAEK